MKSGSTAKEQLIIMDMPPIVKDVCWVGIF